jgi:serine/threonine protein kinase
MGFLFHGLEGKKIYHFDIKPDNILVKDGNYLIADFGTSYVKKNKNNKKLFFSILKNLISKDIRSLTSNHGDRQYCFRHTHFYGSRIKRKNK